MTASRRWYSTTDIVHTTMYNAADDSAAGAHAPPLYKAAFNGSIRVDAFSKPFIINASIRNAPVRRFVRCGCQNSLYYCKRTVCVVLTQ